jgi:hypothetical protein
MAKRDDIAAQIAALQAELDADDAGSVELWVKDEHGRETKLTGDMAKRWLKKLGLDDEPDPAGDGGDGGDGQGGAPGGAPADPPPAGDSVWGRKKAGGR